MPVEIALCAIGPCAPAAYRGNAHHLGDRPALKRYKKTTRSAPAAATVIQTLFNSLFNNNKFTKHILASILLNKDIRLIFIFPTSRPVDIRYR